MRPGCFCLRPGRDASQNAELHREQTGLHETDSINGATLEPQLVRPVSPADVRRTQSGRVIKQQAEARIQAIREASTDLRVLGGQMMPCVSPDRLQSSSEVTSFRQVQQSSGRPRTKRILQPAAVPLADCKQEQTLLQLLRRSRKSLKSDSAEPVSVCKSILEASERRLQRHQQATAISQAATQMAVIRTFSDAYLLAVSEGDQQWASATKIAASFSPDAVLKTQDKQIFYGKPAVLKRLNSGVGMLLKLLGNGKNTNMPRPVISGPTQIDDKIWSISYSFKHGVVKYGIKSQFTFLEDKIVMIQNARV